MDCLQNAKKGLDTIISSFTPENLPPAMGFHYHQGVFLRGMEEYYKITNEQKYYDYLKQWVDLFVCEDGEVKNCHTNEFDDLQPLNLVFELYRISGEEKYKKALDKILPNYLTWQTNTKGGFWHKWYNENEMWLDTLYMAGPLGVHYGAMTSQIEYIDLIYKQFDLMWENMRDTRSGLLYHAWDETKKQTWADSKTGLSSCFWGRSIGWVPAAITDILELTPDDYLKKKSMIERLNILLEDVCSYQNEDSGMWYQIVNRGNDENNWFESSCTCLFAYAIAKAIRNGYIDNKYYDNAKKAYEGVKRNIDIKEDGLYINDICIGTGVMNYEEYLARPRSVNDLHGMGAYVLMCCEIHRIME